MSQSVKNYYASMEAMAKHAFADHELKTVLEQEDCLRWYQCRRPSNSTYAFDLLFKPGAIFLHGDVLDMALFPGVSDSRAWLLKAVGSRDYVLEKIGHGRENRWTFLEDGIDEALKGRGPNVRKAFEALRWEMPVQYAWQCAWRKADLSDEAPALMVIEAQTLWQYYALCRWAELYKATQCADPVATKVEVL